MSIVAPEAIVEGGQIRLPSNVRLGVTLALIIIVVVSITPIGKQSAQAQSSVDEEPAEIAVGSVLFTGFSSGSVTVVAWVGNPNLSLYLPGSEYTVTAYDATGLVVGSDTGVFSLGAGEERWVVHRILQAPVDQVARAGFQVRRSRPFRPAESDPAPPITVLQSTLQIDRLVMTSGRQVGQVRNDGAESARQVQIDVVYFDGAGELLAATQAFLSDVKAGETTSFSTSPVTLRTPPADLKTFAYATLERITSR
jgi:hypothetical protein